MAVSQANFRLDRAIVDPATGRPTVEFLTAINNAFSSISNQFTGIEQALAAAGIALAAADAANAAAAGADAAASAAAREQELVNSYPEPSSVVSASPTDITIIGHERYYANAANTHVAMTGAVVPHAYAAGTIVYVSYVHPSRAAGAVTYILSTTKPVQTGDTHVVGAVEIPAVGTVPGGDGPARPGEVVP